LLCLSPRLWTLDARRSTLDARRSTLDARRSTLDARRSTLDARRSTLDTSSGLRAGEFFTVKDVSFELRRGELRTPGWSEKEISKKCLGATKVPDSGRRRHQCLGLIGHNGAGKTTLLKMLNGLIKPDRGTITMRGRVGALIALGLGLIQF
jgi:ABC-type glutathione transport system ATPase component